MRIGIIGSGRIGANAGRLFAGAGHKVMFSFSRDLTKLEALAESVGKNASTGSPQEAADFGDVVVLSVPWAVVEEALKAIGPLDGKVLIEIPPTSSPQKAWWRSQAESAPRSSTLAVRSERGS